MKLHDSVLCSCVYFLIASVPFVANAQWQPDGVPICTATDDQEQPTIVTDGSGGAIIAWQDYRDGAPNESSRAAHCYGHPTESASPPSTPHRPHRWPSPTVPVGRSSPGWTTETGFPPETSTRNVSTAVATYSGALTESPSARQRPNSLAWLSCRTTPEVPSSLGRMSEPAHGVFTRSV